MKFIKLHGMNKAEIRINMDNMECYGIVTEKTYANVNKDFIGKTYICPSEMGESDIPYLVEETPEEIDKLLDA